jgi:multiple sugar transport system permease protein
MPLFVFVTLIHLMDAYRVFEPILVFSGGQGADSLQHLTYKILSDEQNFHKASAAALIRRSF